MYYCTILHTFLQDVLVLDSQRSHIANGVSEISSYSDALLLKSKTTQPPYYYDHFSAYIKASNPKITANKPLLTPRTLPALVPPEELPVGVLVLLVGADVPLAEDADLDALETDEPALDLLVDVWLAVEVAELVVEVSVEEEVEEEVDEEVDEVVEDVAATEAVGEALDSTESEPLTVILSL